MIDLDVNIVGEAEFRKAVKFLSGSVRDVKTIRKMLRPGVKPIRDSIRKVTPKSKRPHYYKKKQGLFIKKKIEAKFIPGHLRKSTQDIAQRKRDYKYFSSIFIGPVFTGKASKGGTFGNTVQNVDAYYAHMVLGSALAYEKQVIDKGYRLAKSISEGLIKKKIDNTITHKGKRAGFKTQ